MTLLPLSIAAFYYCRPLCYSPWAEWGFGILLKGTSTKMLRERKAFLTQFPHIDFPSWCETEKRRPCLNKLNLQAAVPLYRFPQTVTTRFTGRTTLSMCVCVCVKCVCTASLPSFLCAAVWDAVVSWVVALTLEWKNVQLCLQWIARKNIGSNGESKYRITVCAYTVYKH